MMKFIFIYQNVCKTITFNIQDDNDLTILELRRVIEKDLQIENFDILDLGRIVKDSEKLSTMERNKFTIYKSRF